MQAHLLGAREYFSGECELHHRLAARYRQASTQAADRGCEVTETAQHVIDRHVGAVLEMPGVRIVAVRATQQASRDEEHNAQPRPVVARRGFVGMAIAKGALLVLDAVFIRSVGRNPDPEVVTTSGFKGLNRRHRGTQLDLAVESAADHVSLLFGCQTNEVHSIARHANRELRVLVRILHRILERLLLDHVQVHMEAAAVEVGVEGLDGLVDQLAFGQMRLLRRDGDRVADAVLRILVRKLCDRQAGREPTMAVPAVHRVGARPERFALAATVRGVSRGLSIHDVRRDREHALRVCRVSIGRVLAYLLHEAGDDAGRDLIDAIVVVAELGCRGVVDILIVHDQSGLIAHDANLSVFHCAQAVGDNRKAGDSERHRSQNVAIVQRHLQAFVEILVVHVVDAVHRMHVGAGQPFHGDVELGHDFVVVEEFAGDRQCLRERPVRRTLRRGRH